MLSKTILTIAIAALLCQYSYADITQKKMASTKKIQRRTTKIVRRRRTLKDVKEPEPKESKGPTVSPPPLATKGPKESKGPTVSPPPKVTKLPKATKTPTTKAPVPAQATNTPTKAPVSDTVSEAVDSEAPSLSPHAVSTKEPAVVVLDEDLLTPTNCTIDTDCGDGGFCNNITCVMAGAPATSGGASRFYYGGVMATMVYGVVLSITLL